MFFGLPVFRGFVLIHFQGCFDILSSFFGFVLSPFSYSFSDSVDFSYSKGSFKKKKKFSGVFCGSSSAAVFFLVLFFLAGLHCLLRMHAINSCVSDT